MVENHTQESIVTEWKDMEFAPVGAKVLLCFQNPLWDVEDYEVAEYRTDHGCPARWPLGPHVKPKAWAEITPLGDTCAPKGLESQLRHAQALLADWVAYQDGKALAPYIETGMFLQSLDLLEPPDSQTTQPATAEGTA